MRLRAALLVALVLVATAVAAQPARQVASPVTVFDQVSRTVEEKFYDPALRGVDWAALKARYRPLVAAASTEAERAVLINRMLDALGASHTGYFVPSDRAYYDLLAIFAANFRDELRRMFPRGEVSYTGIGLFTREVGGKVFVTGVLEGLPGEKAGLHVGDEIVAVDGRPFSPVEAFAGRAGVSMPLDVRRTANGPVERLAVVPERIAAGRAFVSAMERSARVIARGGRRIGYVHVWSYAGAHVQQALERELYSGVLKKYRIGEVIGTRTAGAVLAARAFLMADGTLLEIPVADVTVDGERLEGVGVTPTIEVPFALEYAEGRDPQLERALEILAG